MQKTLVGLERRRGPSTTSARAVGSRASREFRLEAVGPVWVAGRVRGARRGLDGRIPLTKGRDRCTIWEEGRSGKRVW